MSLLTFGKDYVIRTFEYSYLIESPHLIFQMTEHM